MKRNEELNFFKGLINGLIISIFLWIGIFTFLITIFK
jgi:hypothetical protein